jgi:hypothetical protein
MTRRKKGSTTYLGTRRASLHGMLFEVAPEESARRVAHALVSAEAGATDAWRELDDAALHRFRSDADSLVVLVPFAFLRLTQQLARHPRSGVRIDAVRYAALAWPWYQSEAEALLQQLAADQSRGVQRAARISLGLEEAFAAQAAQ